MPNLPREFVRLAWNFASRFCSRARNPQMTPVLCSVVLQSSLFLLFFAAWATAADGGPNRQADIPPANPPSSAARPSDDMNQPTTAGTDEAKPSSDKKDAPSQEAMPTSAQGVSPRTPPPAIEPGQMYFELRYNVDGTDIQGNRERSFLHQGINHTAEFSFFSNEPIGDLHRFEILAVGRYTNNPQVDPQRNSLQRAYLRLQGPSFEVNLGDVLVNFSRLTFNQNVKGLTFSKKILPQLKFIGTVGYFVDRWGSLYRDYSFFRDLAGPPNPLSPGKPYSRFVAGTRVEQQIGRGNWIAMNWSRGKDLQQSLPDATLACVSTATGVITIEKPVSAGCSSGQTEIAGFRRPFPEAVNNDVLSADTNMEYVPWHLGFRGEFAYSWSSGGMPPVGANSANFACAPVSPIVGADVLDARCFVGQVGDWAGRLEAHERIKKLTLRTDYSRFEPNFFSANARQIRDVQDFTVRGEYELTRSVSVIGSWRRSNDNLNGLRNFTNVVRAPEGRLVFRELPFYRRMVLEFGYRERNLETAGDPQVTCFNASTTMTIRRPARSGCLSGETPQSTEQVQRSTRIPFLSLTVPVGRANIAFDYEHRHEMNAVTPQLSTDTDRFAIGYRAHYTWDRWEFSPTARFEIERLDKDTPLNAALTPTDINLLFPADFFSAFDTNRSIQAGFLLDTPRYIRIEGSYKEFNGLALSGDQVNQQSPFLYFNEGFRRPSWRAAVTYKIGNDENRTVTAFYVRTNNFFPNIDPTKPDSRSFRETVIGGAIVLRFRK